MAITKTAGNVYKIPVADAGAVVGVGMRIAGVRLVAGAGAAASAQIYDGAAASDPQAWASAAAVAANGSEESRIPIYCQSGVFVAITGAGAVLYLYEVHGSF